MTAQVKVGPIVDKVIFDVRMDQTIGIKDIVEGKTDMFMQGLDGRPVSTPTQRGRQGQARHLHRPLPHVVLAQ
ncbi:MAG: hypothetical protein M0C28_24475 [Candidatus Moduliflexus flocculans]|nr:hypothetical protein [Candidatus Moduliflexus flocculans]